MKKDYLVIVCYILCKKHLNMFQYNVIILLNRPSIVKKYLDANYDQSEIKNYTHFIKCYPCIQI